MGVVLKEDRCVIVVGMITGKGRASKGDWDKFGGVGGGSDKDASHAEESERLGTPGMSTWASTRTVCGH